MHAYRNTNLWIGMHLHVKLSLHSIWLISISFGVIHKCHTGGKVDIHFGLTISFFLDKQECNGIMRTPGDNLDINTDSLT